VALLLVVAATALRADPTDDYVRAQMKRFDVPGISLAVLKDAKIIKIASYGLADVARNVRATDDKVYKIGSVSKQFIATGIMLLVQEGRLRIDDPVSTYLAGTPPAWQAITVRHLLTHTAGLVRESPGFDPMKAQADADLVRATYEVPLLFTPGTQWAYSNTGYYVLAEIMARVAGKPWQEFLHERVFKPAGMTRTMPTNVMPTLPNRAIGYTGRNNQQLAEDWVALRPSGAFVSTLQDIAKWDALLYTNRILSDATRRQMWTTVRLTDGTTYPYGFGWHADTRNGHRIVWHGGGLPGFASYFGRFVEDRLSVIMFANGNDVDLIAVAHGLADLYLSSSKPATTR
jgi:D-alanyl-D-alanine carboxypeptidase